MLQVAFQTTSNRQFRIIEKWAVEQPHTRPKNHYIRTTGRLFEEFVPVPVAGRSYLNQS